MERTIQKYTQGPYEKFMELGAQALTDAELLAVILRTGTKDKSAVELAYEILRLPGFEKRGLMNLYHVPMAKLCEVHGIGLVKAVKLKCIAELSARISRGIAKEGLIINNPKTISEYFMETLRHRKTECVMLVCMDAKGEMIGEKMISQGSVKMAPVSPREVFMEALSAEAVSIILVHNHPSGNPQPSEADEELTKQLYLAGKQLDIPLLDHIIIGDNRYFSFKEANLI